MRTTIRIDDELYRQIKVRAARIGRPIGAVIEDAIRTSLAASPDEPSRKLRPLPTFGKGGTMPGVDLADNAAMLDLMEEHAAVDARD